MEQTPILNVAVYIDKKNIDGHDIDYDNIALINHIKNEIGNILKCNSYWATGSNYENHVLDQQKFSMSLFKMAEQGITLVPVPTIGKENPKNITDTAMAVDIISDLYENNSINTFVIVTSDKDFIPVFKKIIEKGKSAILIVVRESVNLEQFCENMGVKILNLGTIMRSCNSN